VPRCINNTSTIGDSRTPNELASMVDPLDLGYWPGKELVYKPVAAARRAADDKLDARAEKVVCVCRAHTGCVVVQTAQGHLKYVHPSRLKDWSEEVPNEVHLSRHADSAGVAVPLVDVDQVLVRDLVESVHVPVHPVPPVQSVPPVQPIPSVSARVRRQPDRIQVGGPARPPPDPDDAVQAGLLNPNPSRKSMTLSQAVQLGIPKEDIADAQLREIDGFRDLGVMMKVSVSEAEGLVRSGKGQFMGHRWVITEKPL